MFAFYSNHPEENCRKLIKVVKCKWNGLKELQLNTLRISSPMSWMDKSTSEMVREKFINVQGGWPCLVSDKRAQFRPHNSEPGLERRNFLEFYMAFVAVPFNNV